MIAKDIMTCDVVVIEETKTVRDAVNVMLETQHHALPVVDAQGTMVGLLSQTEILRLFLPQYAEHLDDLAFLPDDFPSFEANVSKAGDVPVADIMNREPVTVTEDTAVVELAALMILRDIRLLPIVSDGKVVGVVGSEDLMEEIVHPHA